MRCTVRRSVEWRVGVVVGFALASAAGVAAGCQSAEDAFAAILATACVQGIERAITAVPRPHGKSRCYNGVSQAGFVIKRAE